MPLPIQRVILSHTLAEPALNDRADTVYYVRSADGKRSIVRQSLSTGLSEVVTAEPAPAGSVGYGSGFFALQPKEVILLIKGGKLP